MTQEIESVVKISDLIIPKFYESFNDTDHIHKIITSGRAGTKSSEAAIEAVFKVASDNNCSVVVIRKRHNKLRKTVYKEILRAIKRLRLDKSDFKITVSPMEIEYLANGNKIYFTGSDSIDDTKGIIDEEKPIKLVILDELTEFFDDGEGEDELQNIEATFIRGNDDIFQMLYLYNPPKNPNAPVVKWREKMVLRDDCLCVHVDYRDVPPGWVGRKLIASAETMAEHDEKQYRWVWLGQSIGVDELIYYMFSDKHKAKPAQQKYNLIGIGVDYGQQNATTYQFFGLDMYRKRLDGLEEYYYSGRDTGKQKSPSEYAKDLVDRTDQLNEEYSCRIFYVYIDPSAKGLAEEIKRAAKGKPYNLMVKDADNTVALGIARVQDVYTYGIISVSYSQKMLIEEMGTYSYDKKLLEKGKEVPVKIDDHCCDALRYLIMGLWSKLKHFLPVKEREVRKLESVQIL